MSITSSAPARQAAAIYAVGGGLVIVNNLLPSPQGLQVNTGLMSAIGVSCFAIAGIILILPWHRWSQRLIVAFPLLGLVVIGVANTYGNVSAYSYGEFYTLTFVYVGLTQRPRAVWWFALPAAAAYVVPLLISPIHDLSAASSMAVVLPVGMLTGWVIARLLHRLRGAGERLAESMESVARSEARYRGLVEGVDEIVYSGSLQTGETAGQEFDFVGGRVTEMLGYDPREFMADPTLWGRVVHPDDRAEAMRLTALLFETREPVNRLYRVLDKRTGEYRWMEDRVTALTRTADRVEFVGLARDATQRIQFQEVLAHRATHDALTGLPNRALLADRLGRALELTARGGPAPAVLSIDLDGFKQINDTLGHAVGDEVLVAVAARFRAAARSTDTVSRAGGDEFVVLLDPLPGPEAAVRFARRVLASLSPAIETAGGPVVVGASIGVAVARSHQSAHDLTRAADAAMYQAKRSGGGVVVAGGDPSALPSAG